VHPRRHANRALHAVPREPAATRIAASLPVAAMYALCAPCHDSTDRKRAAEHAQALRDQADTSPLF
jgi:hypothetical protein